MQPPLHVDHGRLILGELLGEGAQAAVHAATRDGARRAVKIVDEDQASLRFVGEISALRAVPHPHLVRVHAAGADGGWQWMEMERISGRTLDGAVRIDGPFEVAMGLAVAFELCMGLAALHDRGIVHRDVKPSNAFLSDARRVGASGVPSPGPAGGRVVLADLGVAQLPAGQVGYATITGTSLGTVDYAAPEQHGDAKRVGPAADQYGVGATLYAITAGTRPSYLYARDDMPHIYERCPEALRELVARCCAHEPADRFPDVRALAEALATLHEAETGVPCVERWMAALHTTTPRPAWCVRQWWWFRRWLR